MGIAEELEMTCEEVATTIAKEYGLNKKEQRLFAYLLNDNNSKNVGDICKALKTTPMTLIGKTKPSLDMKLDQIPDNDGPEVKLIVRGLSGGNEEE